MTCQQTQAVKALGVIERYAQRTGQAWLGQKTMARIMAEKAGRKAAPYGDRQIRRYRAQLEADGLLESQQNASHYRTNLYRVTPAGQLLLRATAGGTQVPERPRRMRVRPSKAPGRARQPASVEAIGGPEILGANVRPDVPKNVRQAFTSQEEKTNPPTPQEGRGLTQTIQTRSRGPSSETEIQENLLAQGKSLALVRDALEQMRQAKQKHGVGHPWKYIQSIVARLERENTERVEQETRRREAEKERVRQLAKEESQGCGPHNAVNCRECHAAGLDMMRKALKLKPRVSEKPSAGVVLPHGTPADVPTERVGGAVASDGHDGVLTAAQPSRGGAETCAQGVPGEALEARSQGHSGDGHADVARVHGGGAQVAVPVHGANERAILELGSVQPSARRANGAAQGVTLVRDSHQTALPSLVSLAARERDEQPFRSVLDILNTHPRQVITPCANDKAQREDKPVPVALERGGEGVRHPEHLRGVQRLCLLLGCTQPVANASEDVRDQTGPGGAFQASGAVGLGDGGHFALNGSHFVPGGAQVRDVAPDSVGVGGERWEPGGGAPAPEAFEVQSVCFSGGVRAGAGGKLVRLGVQPREVHGLPHGGVLDEHKGGGDVGHGVPGGLNVQTSKPLEAQVDHKRDSGASLDGPQHQ